MKNKIIWAVDPTQDPREAKNLMKSMKIWAKHLDCSIQPVSIFSNQIFNLPLELANPTKEKFESITQNLLNNYFKKVNIKNFLPAHKILTSSSSKRKMAAALAQYAEKEKALFIFANTRAKKTWNPFRLGGFAETLVAVSRTPVLLFNTRVKPSTRIPSILFPTDLGRESKAALLNLILWAQAFNSKILLFNQLETPAIYEPEFDGYWHFQSANIRSFIKDLEKSRQKKALKLTHVLTQQNIKNQTLIQPQKNSLASDILETAKKYNVNLIALASHGGPLAQAILGSVSRDVLLQATCPVLIFHNPKLTRKSAPQKKQFINTTYKNQKDVAISARSPHG